MAAIEETKSQTESDMKDFGWEVISKMIEVEDDESKIATLQEVLQHQIRHSEEDPEQAVKIWRQTYKQEVSSLLSHMTESHLLDVVPLFGMERSTIKMSAPKEDGALSQEPRTPEFQSTPLHENLEQVRIQLEKTQMEAIQIEKDEEKLRKELTQDFSCEPLLTSLSQQSDEQCERDSHAHNALNVHVASDCISALREQSVSRRRRNLRPRATKVLTEWFDTHQQNPYPTDHDKQLLAMQAGVEVEQVTNWFSNKRNRRQQK